MPESFCEVVGHEPERPVPAIEFFPRFGSRLVSRVVVAHGSAASTRGLCAVKVDEHGDLDVIDPNELSTLPKYGDSCLTKNPRCLVGYDWRPFDLVSKRPRRPSRATGTAFVSRLD